ncbi:feather keratin 1-like [Chroicocephalus ridibundus]|uniref:feather keratin 1-like n=1 Tax=Chroicocephalus ridibundus TaxID=1192867 RepID=UPI002FDC8C93
MSSSFMPFLKIGGLLAFFQSSDSFPYCQDFHRERQEPDHSTAKPASKDQDQQPLDSSAFPKKPCGPTPLANSCNEPCVRQCQDSTVVIQPSPVVVTLPGPILSSFPQSTAVGNSTSAAVGSILSSAGVPISSGGFGLSDLSGLGSRYCGTRCRPC